MVYIWYIIKYIVYPHGFWSLRVKQLQGWNISSVMTVVTNNVQEANIIVSGWSDNKVLRNPEKEQSIVTDLTLLTYQRLF